MNPVHHIWNILLYGLLFLLIGLSYSAMADPTSSGSTSFVFPSDPFSYQPGPGSSIASSYCGMCHSAEYVYMQPPHSKEQWADIVHKMKSAFGCPIPEDQIPTLVTYLVSQNEMQPSLNLKMEGHQAPPLPKDKANAEKGKSVYESYCLACHGAQGKGDGPVGSALTPPPSDLTATGKKSDQFLLQTIQNGRPGTAMPSWKEDISPQDIQDVLAYIRQLSQ